MFTMTCRFWLRQNCQKDDDKEKKPTTIGKIQRRQIQRKSNGPFLKFETKIFFSVFECDKKCRKFFVILTLKYFLLEFFKLLLNLIVQIYPANFIFTNSGLNRYIFIRKLHYEIDWMLKIWQISSDQINFRHFYRIRNNTLSHSTFST